MNMKRFVAKCLSLPILAIAFAAHAQTVPFDLEIGYRWLDLKGSNEMYRTQINERGGLIHPIAITRRNELIAGERRLLAWQLPECRFHDHPIPGLEVQNWLRDPL